MSMSIFQSTNDEEALPSELINRITKFSTKETVNEHGYPGKRPRPRSVPVSDLVPIRIKFPGGTGAVAHARAIEEHKWFDLGRQKRDEIFLSKTFGSKVDGRAGAVPRMSFVDENFVGEEAGKSVEVRAFVLHEGEAAD